MRRDTETEPLDPLWIRWVLPLTKSAKPKLGLFQLITARCSGAWALEEESLRQVLLAEQGAPSTVGCCTSGHRIEGGGSDPPLFYENANDQLAQKSDFVRAFGVANCICYLAHRMEGVLTPLHSMTKWQRLARSEIVDPLYSIYKKSHRIEMTNVALDNIAQGVVASP